MSAIFTFRVGIDSFEMDGTVEDIARDALSFQRAKNMSKRVARGGALVGHIPDRVEEDDRAEDGSHPGEQHAQPIDVEGKGERAIPGGHVEIDRLSGLQDSREGGDAEDRRDAGQRCKHAFDARGKDAGNEKLDGGTGKEDDRRQKDKFGMVHGRHLNLSSIGRAPGKALRSLKIQNLS